MVVLASPPRPKQSTSLHFTVYLSLPKLIYMTKVFLVYKTKIFVYDNFLVDFRTSDFSKKEETCRGLKISVESCSSTDHKQLY
jgi:hypothetical protein